MNDLLAQIKKDRMNAMKVGDTYTKDTLTVLLGDLESDSKRGKTVDDAYITNAIKKAVQNASENYKLTGDKKFMREENLLGAYLPKQMDEAELIRLIEVMITNGASNIGTVMKELKSQYDGQFDGKTASKLAREML